MLQSFERPPLLEALPSSSGVAQPALRSEPLSEIQALTDWTLTRAGKFEIPAKAWVEVVYPIYRFLNGSISRAQLSGSSAMLPLSEVAELLVEVEKLPFRPPDIQHFVSKVESYWLGRGWYPLCGELIEHFTFADNTPVSSVRFHLVEERSGWAVSDSLYREALALFCRGLALTAHLRQLGIHLEPEGGLPVDNQALCRTIGELGSRIILWEKEHGSKTAAPGLNSEDLEIPVNLILRWGLAVMLDLSVHDPRRSIFADSPELRELWPNGHESAIPYYTALAISELPRSFREAGIGDEQGARRLVSEVLRMDWEQNQFRSPFLLNNSFIEFDSKTCPLAMSICRPTRERAFVYALPINYSEFGRSDRMPTQRDFDEARGFQQRHLL